MYINQFSLFKILILTFLTFCGCGQDNQDLSNQIANAISTSSSIASASSATSTSSGTSSSVASSVTSTAVQFNVGNYLNNEANWTFALSPSSSSGSGFGPNSFSSYCLVWKLSYSGEGLAKIYQKYECAIQTPNGAYADEGDCGYVYSCSNDTGFYTLVWRAIGVSSWQFLKYTTKTELNQSTSAVTTTGANSNEVCTNDVCNCHGYTGVGGACFAGVGGPAYAGVGGGAYAGVGGPCYAGVGGPKYAGVGGSMYAGIGGPMYAGVGGAAYTGIGGAAYAGVGGPCYAGVGGACYAGVGGGCLCPKVCQ